MIFSPIVKKHNDSYAYGNTLLDTMIMILLDRYV